MTQGPAPGHGRDEDPARHARGPADPTQSAGATIGPNSTPRWQADHLPDGNVQWTTPAGRQYTTEPTRYPI
jgi:hypothetical protein